MSERPDITLPHPYEWPRIALNFVLRTLFLGAGYALIGAGDLDAWRRERRKRIAARRW